MSVMILMYAAFSPCSLSITLQMTTSLCGHLLWADCFIPLSTECVLHLFCDFYSLAHMKWRLRRRLQNRCINYCRNGRQIQMRWLHPPPLRIPMKHTIQGQACLWSWQVAAIRLQIHPCCSICYQKTVVTKYLVSLFV